MKLKIRNFLQKCIISLTIAGSMIFADAASAKNTIALLLSTLDNPFFISLKEGAQQEATKLGYRLIVLDSQNDSSKELANMEDMLVRGIDLVLVNPTDSNAVATAISMANKKNIPVITLDRNSNKGNVESHIASDNVAGGFDAGTFIFNKLGKGAKVIELEGIPGTSASNERGQGFAQAVKKYDFEVLAKQPADFDRAKGLNVMENLLAGRGHLQAVFAQNDEMALGALRALQAANKKDVIIVGFDGTKDALAAIKAGKISATIAQQPDLIGQLGIITADKILKGQSVDRQIPVPLKVITK